MTSIIKYVHMEMVVFKTIVQIELICFNSIL